MPTEKRVEEGGGKRRGEGKKMKEGVKGEGRGGKREERNCNT